MPFNSLQYFMFLPVVFLVFYFAGDRVRWAVLLAASLLFYASLKAPCLMVVLMLVVLTTYGFGIWIGKSRAPTAKLSLLWGGVAANVLILVIIKYLPGLSKGLGVFAAPFSVYAQLHPVQVFISIGVSYYVFQAISYLIDIYLEITTPERHLGYFALHMAFFPKLLQGPIERAGRLLPQLKVKYEFNYTNMRFGILLFAWGLFKKVVIADRLGLYVDAVYNDVYAFKGLPLLLATYAYSFQIYMDFSGYTDMALGSARIFNINLTQNFNSPYSATSVVDFWRRWHISFSSWILDYIFKPLQMQWRDLKNWGTAAALMITFLVSGIWHDAGLKFAIWGFLHGLYLSGSVFYKPFQKKFHKTLGIENAPLLKLWKIFATFNLVSFAWIFFRANDAPQAFYIISNLFRGARGCCSGFLFSQGKFELGVVLLTTFFAFLFDFEKAIDRLFKMNRVFRHTAYFLLIIFVVLFGRFADTNFIYFKF